MASDLHYFRPDWIEPSDEVLDVDVCVYGGCAGGVMAAYAAAQRGHSVVLLHPGKFLGGLTTGGLGWTDTGNKAAIGGLSRQFYRRLGQRYGEAELWQFAPSDAEQVLSGFLAEADFKVRLCQYIEAVDMQGLRIAAIRMLGGLTVRARFYLDASYEGDLLARTGVRYTVGRESNDTYSETLNGVQIHRSHQFSHPVDPYITPGDPASGLLPYVDDEDRTTMLGQGDHRVQAYNFRVCMSDDPALRIPWAQPEGYDPMEHELAVRWFNADKDGYNELLSDHAGNPTEVPCKFDILPHKTPGGYHKTDTNNHGPVSSDYIGANYDWPEASYEQREAIFQAHVRYQRGHYWTLANDSRIPERYREAFSRWGLASDEFTQTEHWPHQLYVREARRMLGDYVVTQHDCEHRRRCPDPVGLASYNMDSHNCSRFVSEGRVLNEGDAQFSPPGPYPVSYHALVPAAGQCENLLVPVCCSTSHIAFGSVRMEPVFMILGESAAIAASLAIRQGTTAQGVPYGLLRAELEKAEQVLESE